MPSDSLTDADRARIADAIAAAETSTAGEIYLVIAQAADGHQAVPLLWSALFALVLPWPLYLFTDLPFGWILLVQVLAFVLSAIVLSLPAIRYRIVPDSLAADATRNQAESIFLAHGVHLTQDRTGVLIYVALAERRVEVLADAGINAKVHASAWDELAAGIVSAARDGRLGDGLVAAVQGAGGLLARHVPPRPDDRNELSDRVVEI